MEDKILIDGRQYISASDAARQFDLTRIYVSRICKEGRIQAKLVGAHWYVDQKSMLGFVREQAALRVRRSIELAQKRSEEYKQNVGEISTAIPTAASRLWVPTQLAMALLLTLGVSLASEAAHSRLAQLYPAPRTQAAAAAIDFLKLPASLAESARSLNRGVDDFVYALLHRNADVQLSSSGNIAPTIASSTSQVVNNNTTTNNVTNNYYTNKTYNTTNENKVAGLSETDVQQKLDILGQSLRNEFANVTRIGGLPSSGGLGNAVAISQRIDRLASATITNSTWTGGSISGVALSAGDLSGVVSISKGGTGTSTAPTYGQLLLGNADGSYDLVATSSLGITGGGGSGTPGGSDTQIQFNDNGAFGGDGSFTFSTSTQTFSVTNSSTTNATSTNFFSTTASSTNLFSQTASLGTLTLVNALSIASGGTNATSFTTGAPLSYDGTRFVSTSTLSSVYGGTGFSSFTQGDILYADSSGKLAKLPIGGLGTVLKVAGGLPSWGADLTSSGSAGLFATTSDSLAIYPSTPSNVLLLGTTATSTTGNIFELLGSALFRGDTVTHGTVTASQFTATSSIASQLPYASSTAFTATNLFSTNFLALGSTTLQNFTALNATTTNATSTTFFATTASSTNLFSQTASLGTLTSGTLALTNALSVSNGGTGATTFNTGEVLVGNGTGAVTSTTTANLKTTLSLNNVENTALSTWAGSSNITTVGTVTSGTWSGLFGAVSGANLTNLTAANIAAGTASITVTGNAGTATKLAATKNINNVAFDGTADITITAASSTLLANNNSWTGLNTFANASSTLFTASSAWVTKLANLASAGFVKTSSDGTLSVDTNTYLTASDVFAYPFALSGNATSTLTQFNGGLTAYATSTIGNGTQTGGLTINGGATTTGNAYFGGSVGIGTTSPSALVAIRGLNAAPGIAAADTFAVYGGTGGTGNFPAATGGWLKLYGGTGGAGTGGSNLGGKGGSIQVVAGVGGAGDGSGTGGDLYLSGGNAGTGSGNSLDTSYGNVYLSSPSGSATNSGKVVVGTSTTNFSILTSKLTVQSYSASGGPANILSALNSSGASVFSVSASGNGTTTLSGLSISAAATSTSNVGFNITSGCFSVGNNCLNSISLSAQNTWTALQLFAAGASTTQLSVFNKAYFGGTGTSTFSSTGNLTLVNAANALTIPFLGTAAGTILAVDASGNVIATTTSSGGVASVSGTANQIASTGGTTPVLSLPSLVIFPGNASSSQFSVFSNAYFGGTATTTIDSTGSIVIPAAGTLTVGGGTTLSSALTYGGVTLSNAVTGTGNMVLSAAPTFTGTAAFANATHSGTLSVTGQTTLGQASSTLISVLGPAYFGSSATSSFSTTGALTLATQLTTPNGGTGQISFTSGNLLYGAGSGALQDVATTSATIGSSLSYSGTFGALVGGAAGTLSLNLANANTWTALQLFSAGASTTNFSNIGTAYFGSTATSTFDSAGNLSLVSNGLTVGTNQLVAAAGNIGIGTTTPFALLSLSANNGSTNTTLFNIASSTLAGTATTSLLSFSNTGQFSIGPNISPVSSSTQFSILAGTTTVTRASQNTLNNQGANIFVQNRIAYITNAAGILEVWDISNPVSPKQLSLSTLNQVGGAIYVQGRYAYLADANSNVNAFEIWDVSNPASPVRVSQNSLLISPGSAIYVQGHFAYITNTNSLNGLEIWDVANPAAPVRVGQGNLNLNGGGIYVQGRYAYLADNNSGANNFEIWDVSTPSAPVRVSSGSLNTTGRRVYVQGRYAYFADFGTTNAFEIWDVSDPGAPVRVSSNALTQSGTGLYVQGIYAYIVGSGSLGGFEIWNVSNPALPVRVALNALSTFTVGRSIHVQGRYAYIVDASNATNAFEVWDLGGAYIQNLEAGALEAGTLSLRNNLAAVDAAFSGGVNIGQSLNVTGSASIVSATSTFNTTASIFSITSASSTNPFFNILGNGSVGIGTTSPYSRLSVWGGSTGNIFEAVTSASSSALTVSATGFGTTTVTGLNVSGSATSTSNVGFNITSGCFAIGGTCLSTSGGVSLSAQNTWTALQLFSAGASTTQLSVFNNAYFGGTATTTIDSAGNVAVAGTLNVTGNTTLANATTTTLFSTTASSTNLFSNLASIGTLTLVNALPIASGGTGTTTQVTNGVNYFDGTRITSNPSLLSFTGVNFGIGTSTPWATLSLQATSGQTNPLFTVASTTGATTTISLAVLANGNVGIGTTTPIDLLHIPGLANPIFASSTTNGLNTPQSVFVSGRYTYVASQLNNSLVIFDVSNPASPVKIGSSTDGLSTPQSVFVVGRYAYVVNTGNGALVIFDVSNPASPVKIGSSTNGLSAPRSVYVAGQYAYIVDNNFSTLVIFDISNPSLPTKISSTGGFNGVRSLSVFGRYAYVLDVGSFFSIYDISNPAAPFKTGSSSSGLSAPRSVYIVGRYAYVADATNGLIIFDVSNAASPANTGSSAAGLSSAQSVFVSGRYAYVASASNNLLVVFDISNPASPTNIGFSSSGLNTPQSVFVSGRYAYVASANSNSLVTFRIGGEYTQSLEAGTLQAGSLQLDNNLQALDAAFSGGVSIGQSLNVTGSASIVSATSTALYATGVDVNVGGISDVFSLTHFATSTASSGIGTGILFNDSAFCSLANCNSATTTATSTARIASIFTSVSTTSPASALAFFTKSSSAGLTEQARITSAGFLGLGTTTPFAQLQIASSSASATFKSQLVLTDTNGGTNAKHVSLTSVNGEFRIGTTSDAYATSTLFSITNASTTIAKALFSSSAATSSFANGINLTTGCFSINGTCLSTSGGVSLSAQNTWTALQLFSAGASTTNFSNIGTAYFGSTATSSFSSSGRLTLASLSSAGLGVDANGLVYAAATTTAGTGLLYTGNTFAIDFTRANSWTGLQSFTNASSSLFSVTNKAYFGGTATSTFDSAGNLSLVSNGLTVGTNQLVAAAGNIGIGTTTPWGALAVSSTSQQSGLIPLFNIASTTNTSLFTVLGNGFVGIGTTTPTQLFHLAGDGGIINISHPTNTSFNSIRSTEDVTGTLMATINFMGSNFVTAARRNDVEIDSRNGGDVTLQTLGTGNVGIGTTTPWGKLAITTLAQQDGTIPLFNIASTTNTSLFSVFGNGFVGIGTTTPWGVLSITVPDNSSAPQFVVASSSAVSLYVSSSGSIGVGTSSPGNIFDISTGATRASFGMRTSSTQAPIIRFRGDAAAVANRALGIFSFQNDVGGAVAQFVAGYTDTDDTHTYMAFSTANGGAATERMRVSNTGYVGIGTTTPWGQLAITTTAQQDGAIPLFNIASTTNTSLFTVLGNGNVGIGTSTPQAILHVGNGTDAPSVGTAATRVLYATADGQTDFFIRDSTNDVEGRVTANVSGVLMGSVTNHSLGLRTGNAERVLIDTSGNVGIGTSTPGAKLDVANGALCVDDVTPTCGNAARTAGTIYAVATAITGIDLAERYPTKDASLSAGEIVGFDPANPVFVGRASSSASFLGVVSTAPGIVLGGYNEGLYRGEIKVPIALAGRVPVKVNLDGGPIIVGDRVTISNTPGVGAKATTTTQTIGIALEPYSGVGTSTIQVFIKPELTFAPNRLAALVGLSDAISTSTVSDLLSGPFSSVSQALRDALSGSSNLVVQVFKQGIYATTGIFEKIFVKELYAQNVYADSVYANQKICVDGQCLTRDDVAKLLQMANVAGGGASLTGSSSTGTSTSPTTPASGPVISVRGNNPAAVEVGTASGYSDLGAMITGPQSALNLGLSVSVDGGATTTLDQVGIDTSVVGTHTIVYSATDQNGLTGTATRIVNVVAPTPPISSQDASSTPPVGTSTTTPVTDTPGEATSTTPQG